MSKAPTPPISWYHEAQHRYQGGESETGDEGTEHVSKLVRGYGPSRWLDFGCSDGTLLELATDVGEGYGYDNDEAALEAATQRGLKVTADWDEIPEVQLVTAVHVIEHMDADELISWMRRWHQRLSSDGRLIIVTSNPDNIAAMCGFWDDWQHTRPYGWKCLIGLGRTLGFETEDLIFRPDPSRRNPLFRLTRKVLSALRMWPVMGSDFVSYALVLRKVSGNEERE